MGDGAICLRTLGQKFGLTPLGQTVVYSFSEIHELKMLTVSCICLYFELLD